MEPGRRIFYTFACFVLLLHPIAQAAGPDITVKPCKGMIKSTFETLTIDAEWNIDWPVEIAGASEVVVSAIRRQICQDALVQPFGGGWDESESNSYDRIDYAQGGLFRSVLRKVNEKEDSYLTRALYYRADLKISLLSDGFLGYTLNGCQNEGGGGCHSYTVVRVISLSTGRPLIESEFIPTNNFPALIRKIIKNVCTARKIEVLQPDELPEIMDKGNFIIEKKGIRWYLPAYSVFCGADGVQNMLVTWDELRPFFGDPNYLKAFQKMDLSQKKVKRIQPKD